MYRTNKAHPWHGISIGTTAPAEVTVFIEIVPRDTVKYEIDKDSGYLKIDRPQQYSNVVPANYGFIPQTFCGERIARLAQEKSNKTVVKGDGDPLDILVLSEHHIPRGDIILRAVPIGGFCLLDHGEADDKIIAVLNNDAAFGHFEEINDCPSGLIERLTHYFLSYKQLPNDAPRALEVTHVYSRDEAHEVISLSFQDYRETFGEPESRIEELRTLLRA